MPSNPTSRTELLLPAIHRALGGALQTVLAQAAEAPLFDAEATEERFVGELLPDGAPSAWLRWLFYAMGADAYWREDYDDTRRRLILRRLFELYRSRGTVDGLGLHLALLAGQTLLKAVQPPAKAFAGASLTPAEREAFEARFPEILFWPYQHAGVARTAMLGRCWPGGAAAETKGLYVPAITDAADRIGDRLEWHDPLLPADRPEGALAVDHVVVTRTETGIIELRLGGRLYGIALGRWLSGFLVDQGAGSRLYHIQPDPVGGRHPLALVPSLAPVRVRTEEIRMAGSGPGLFLWNRYADLYPDRGGSHLPAMLIAQHAERRIGQRLKIFDAARVPAGRRAGYGFLGAAALGTLPAHEMIALVQMPGQTGARVVWPGRQLGGCIAASDAPDRIARGRWAGGLARRGGCKIVLDVQSQLPLLAGEQVLTGTHAVGELIR